MTIEPSLSKTAVESTRCVTLYMEGDIGSLSPNAVIKLRWTRGGIARIRKLKDDWHLRAVNAWNRAGCPVFTTKVRISYFVYRGRALDEGNLCASEALKAIEDSLIGRAYKDDSPRYVERGEVKQITGAEYRQRPVLLMRIESVGG